MPNSKNQAGIWHLFKTVKSHIARTAARNQQLTQAIFHRTAYLRVASQNMDCFLNQINGLKCGLWIAWQQKVGQTYQVLQGTRRIAQLCQGRAFGTAVVFPATR